MLPFIDAGSWPEFLRIKDAKRQKRDRHRPESDRQAEECNRHYGDLLTDDFVDCDLVLIMATQVVLPVEHRPKLGLRFWYDDEADEGDIQCKQCARNAPRSERVIYPEREACDRQTGTKCAVGTCA